jgi:hypothetical protein
MKTFLLKIACLGWLTFGLTGCYNSIEKTLLSGQYDAALMSALPKLKNSRKKDEYVNIALKAYYKVMDADKYKIEQLKANNDGSNWGKIYYIYKQMEQRQMSIEPYLPITYSNGELANIELFNYLKVIEEARKNAAEHHYNLAKQLLTQPYKEAARNAYYELQQIDQFYPNYADKEALKFEAKQKGTNHIYIDFKQSYGLQLPAEFLSSLGNYNYERELADWTVLHRTRTDSSIFDMVIQVTIEAVDITPEHVKESRFVESKQVSDGFQNLLDSEGKPVKDSLGNIIQVEKFRTLYCDITEWTQTKSARIISSFEIFDYRYNRKVVTQPIEDQVHFVNNYASAVGHLDILSVAIQQKLRGRPAPFPTNFEMILQTSENLKIQIARSIDANDDVLASL